MIFPGRSNSGPEQFRPGVCLCLSVATAVRIAVIRTVFFLITV